MTHFFRWFSAILFVSALVALATLLISDGLNHLQLTSFHQNAAAWSLIFIGASYLGVQFVSRRPAGERVKAILLSSAFLLWGSEQMLPSHPWVTAMDTAVILIFVVDLGLVVLGGLHRVNHE
jgi:hypothetical protein